MPGQTQLVRLLRRRTGISIRPQPEPILEVAEVFRLDILGQAFGGELPPLRVIFTITQEQDRAMEPSYPFELPELEDSEHPCLAFSRRIFKAIFEDDDEEAFLLQLQYQRENPSPFSLRNAFILWGKRKDYGQFDEITPEEFCTSRHFRDIYNKVSGYSPSDYEYLILTLNYIFVSFPEYSLVALTLLDDLPTFRSFHLTVLTEHAKALARSS